MKASTGQSDFYYYISADPGLIPPTAPGSAYVVFFCLALSPVVYHPFGLLLAPREVSYLHDLRYDLDPQTRFTGSFQLLLKLHKDVVPTNLSVAVDPPVSLPAKTPIPKPALCNVFRMSVNATKDSFVDHLVVSDAKPVETKLVLTTTFFFAICNLGALSIF